MENTKWLIWSIEHDAWWRPEKKGYTCVLKEAGVYSYEDACKIVEGANYCLTMPKRARYDKALNIPMEAMILLTFEKEV